MLVLFPEPLVSDLGTAVVAMISASIRSEVMSLGRIFLDCAISVKVRVRSTRVSRPSVADSRSKSRCARRDSELPFEIDWPSSRGEDAGEGATEGRFGA